MADNIEILTRSQVRAMARHLVALDGYWGNIRLVEKGKTDKLLEEAIQAEEGKILSRKYMTVYEDNALPGYGIDSSTLSCFRGVEEERFDINYNLLRQIYTGLKYTISEGRQGIPHEYLSAMNTFEILSIYRAFGKLIKDGCIELGKQKLKIDELKEMPAETAVSKMVSYGYRHQAMQIMRKRGCTYFPTGKGDLIKRIKPFNRQLKDRFMELLNIKKENIKEKYDSEKMGKEDYIAAISSLMQEIYYRKY